MEIAVFLITLLGIAALGVPIAFALLISGIALMLFLGNFETQMIASQLIDGTNKYSLMAIPFFILVGELMNAGGVSKRIIDFAMTIVGHVNGGLGYVAIIACVFFAGLSGSAVADTAALGAILVPMMVKQGYDRGYSMGVIATGGIIAPIIPPGIALIVFGVATGVSISDLFIAGIIPGLLMGIFLAITWWLLIKKGVINAKVQSRQTFKDVLQAGKSAVWALLLPIIIIGGIRFGIFTPTESATIAAVYALFIGFVVYRELKLTDLYMVFVRSAKMSSVIMLLVGAATVPAWLITVANIPAKITQLLDPLIAHQFLLLVVICFILILMGTVMDATPVILVVAPLLMPTIIAAGIDPVVFGIIFILTTSIGLLTPPVGTVLNVATSVGNLSMEDMVKGVTPFLIAQSILLFLLILFPYPITFLVNWLN